MAELHIEDYICRELSPEDQFVATSFVGILKDHQLRFVKDNGACWRDKIYYWVTLGNECVCFVAIKDPDEKDHHWTIWSADMGSPWLESDSVDDDLKETAWKHVDHCGHCGSCGGGRQKIIFGKAFDDVCGCTFRIDNPQREDMAFLKKMVEIRIKEIIERQ